MEVAVHREYAVRLKTHLADNFCEVYNPVDPDTGLRVQKTPPRVHCFLMDLRGGVEVLEAAGPGGPECPPGGPSQGRPAETLPPPRKAGKRK